MSNDKELLLLAANAMGYEGAEYKEPSNAAPYVSVPYPEGHPSRCDGFMFQPLTSMADALHLAVHLELSVVCNHDEVSVCYVSPEDCHYFDEPHGDDKNAAACRAITRAAAYVAEHPQ
tara:strand:- start:368 stop:721 length:354 start_codon:yes stop_codon:yes gene_type:complete